MLRMIRTVRVAGPKKGLKIVIVEDGVSTTSGTIEPVASENVSLYEILYASETYFPALPTTDYSSIGGLDIGSFTNSSEDVVASWSWTYSLRTFPTGINPLNPLAGGDRVVVEYTFYFDYEQELAGGGTEVINVERTVEVEFQGTEDPIEIRAFDPIGMAEVSTGLFLGSSP